MKKILLLVIVTVTSAQAALRLPPVTYNVTELIDSQEWAVPLAGGRIVRLNKASVPGAQVLFKDLLPGANWKHPALYQVVSRDGKVIEEKKVMYPPKNLMDAPVYSGEAPRPRGRVQFRINDFKGEYKVKDADRYHALLINGSADERHWNDFSFLFRVLTQMYGYKAENITVLDGAFKDRQPDLDGDGKRDIHYSSRLTDLKEVMGNLKTKLKPNDQLLIAVNDHGGFTGGESTIVLYDGEIKASEYAKLFNQLPAQRILSIHEQCHSGGFVRPSVSSGKVAMSAAKDTEYSWASQDLNFDEFIYQTVVAFAKQKHDGTVVNADINRDQKISAQEAFGYAVANDAAAESPLLESYNNSGGASQIGLNF